MREYAFGFEESGCRMRVFSGGLSTFTQKISTEIMGVIAKAKALRTAQGSHSGHRPYFVPLS
jgi:hypothetical protein